jgi:hypothetical protein
MKTPPNKKTLTVLGLKNQSCPKSGQVVVWDKVQIGLSVQFSHGGTKSYRSTFKLNGRPVTRTLGRVGELDVDKETDLATARELVRKDRVAAKAGTDPRIQQQLAKTDEITFEQMVNEFITKRCKPRQRSWDQTERILKNNCANWLQRPVGSISKREVIALLDDFVAEDKPYKAHITRAWLRTMWRWAYRRELVIAPMIDSVDLEFVKRKRDRVYSDDEIAATWAAAEQLASSKSPLESQEGHYVKLLILLAPRKTALACLRWSHLDKDLTTWVTPFALTKSRRSG